MRPFRLRVLVLCASLLVAGVRVVAQDRITPRPGNEGPARVHNYREMAISPDGRRVAWVEVFDGTGGPSSGLRGSLLPTWQRVEGGRGGSRREPVRPGAPNIRSPGRRMAGGSRFSPITTSRGSSRFTSPPRTAVRRGA
jgi:hypothetical protein